MRTQYEQAGGAVPGAWAKCENGYEIFPYHNAKTLSSVKKIHLIRPINSYHKLDLSLLQRGAVLSDGALLPRSFARRARDWMKSRHARLRRTSGGLHERTRNTVGRGACVNCVEEPHD